MASRKAFTLSLQSKNTNGQTVSQRDIDVRPSAVEGCNWVVSERGGSKHFESKEQVKKHYERLNKGQNVEVKIVD